ncbi:uncharacterized protein [Amphiura filiformis]|uniref:uncharacterized protein n=1 Tax=Amphiura filiformis TaxID=82378 RepID=UPI003B21F82A
MTTNFKLNCCENLSFRQIDEFYMTMLSQTEALYFLKYILKITSIQEKLINDKAGLLDEIINIYRQKIPYQSITVISRRDKDQHLSTMDDIKAQILSTQGGLCYDHNIFTKHLLEALGFDVYLNACETGLNGVCSHVSVLVKNLVKTGDKYYVDVGTRDPFFQAISLDFDKESPVYKCGFQVYKFVKEGEEFSWWQKVNIVESSFFGAPQCLGGFLRVGISRGGEVRGGVSRSGVSRDSVTRDGGGVIGALGALGGCSGFGTGAVAKGYHVIHAEEDAHVDTVKAAVAMTSLSQQPYLEKTHLVVLLLHYAEKDVCTAKSFVEPERLPPTPSAAKLYFMRMSYSTVPLNEKDIIIDGWRKYMTFTLEPREIEYFRDYMIKHYVTQNPPMPGLTLLQLMCAVAYPGQKLLAIRGTSLLYENDEGKIEKTKIRSKEELVDLHAKYFPQLPGDLVKIAIEKMKYNFEK